jgi:cell division protein FtsZ
MKKMGILVPNDAPLLLGTRIKVIGVGGSGCQTIARIAEVGLAGVELVALDSDIRSLSRYTEKLTRLQIGSKLTKGLGAGADPLVGHAAALEDTEKLLELVVETDVVFVSYRLGGGIGTGAGPVVASLASEVGALTIVIATRPFAYEGHRSQAQANSGLADLNGRADIVIVLSNDELLRASPAAAGAGEAFRAAEDATRHVIERISGLILNPGLVSHDLADVRAVLRRGGRAIIGTGRSSGRERAAEAARTATAALLNTPTQPKPRRGIVAIEGGPDLALPEVREVSEIIFQSIEADAQIVFGTKIVPELAGSIQVTVIATDFESVPQAAQNRPRTTVDSGEDLAAIVDGKVRRHLPAYARRSSDLPEYSSDLPGARKPSHVEGGYKPADSVPRQDVDLPLFDDAPPPVDPLTFSVTAPVGLLPGSSFVVDVWGHRKDERDEVLRRAREGVETGKVTIKSKGPFAITRGTPLSINLTLNGLEVAEPEDWINWEGEIGNASFLVTVPPDSAEGPRAGRATIRINGLQIARLDFVLQVGHTASPVDAIATNGEVHRTAFASYASEDLNDVLARIQGIQKAAPHMSVFLDVVSLRSGQHWEDELWQRIPKSDVFYLFWSANASRSVWVEKEWRCALSTRGLGFIDPVPLVSPETAPPPAELTAKHFNDWVLAFKRNP